MRLKLSFPHAFEQWLNKIVKRPSLAVTVLIVWLVVIGWVAYGWNLGRVGLIDETEPLFAEASRQMLITGDWITPYFNGETRFDKPALIYWLQAIAYAVIGVNEWAVRLPSALAAMGVMALVFSTVYWSLTKKDELKPVSSLTRPYLAAAVAAAVTALNPEMIIWGRTGVSDMLLTGCIASALLCFFRGYAEEGTGDRGQGTERRDKIPNNQSPFPNKWYLACYALIAGAILTKGPVGIVLPGLIIGAFLLYVGQLWAVVREMRLLLGLVIIFCLSVPWYLLVTWRNGWNYINSFFGYHNIERFTDVVNGHSAPWYFYFLIVLLLFAPYSVYLPLAMIRLKFWQRSHWRTQERSQQLGLFAFIWFITIFSFFTAAVTKLPSYVLPLMPAAAILVALLWSDFFSQPQPNTSKTAITYPISFLQVSSWINVVFLSVLSVALFHLSYLLGKDPAAPNFNQMLQNSGLPEIGGWIWLLFAVIVAVLILRRQWQAIIGVNLLGFAAFLMIMMMPALLLVDQERQLPLRDLSAAVVQFQKPQEEIIMVGFKKPSVVFYSRKPIKFIKLRKEGIEYIQNVANQTNHPASMLLLTEKRNFFKMDLQPDNYQNLAIKGAYQLTRINFKKMKSQKLDIS
ncbi:ArnT family glycosyltransferase [Nostoc sp. UHCC 0870]|uniref:ArnT family glycosyltransferase n=1 Tax=Nostoc sp. UHCC 0870 TaxID=2914041 RepID=UPI001EE04DA5|nr:glycosyltransferase family 39 protein [Nostoc sp. UHCC 0870]UKO97921.1 glycosyltransferase family 39 protein [Nostoc sp. UHCC 0870]